MMKKGGIVVPNIYTVGEGGTKKSPRPEVYISDTGEATEVGKKGPETIAVRESGLIIPHPKTIKEMEERKCGGRVIASRQRGGRVSGQRVPENIMRAIGLIKGKYDADIQSSLQKTAQFTRAKAQGMTNIDVRYRKQGEETIKGLELTRDERLKELAKYYHLSSGDLRSIPAIYQPYREPRIKFTPETKRQGEKEKLEWLIEQEKKDFDPDYPQTP